MAVWVRVLSKCLVVIGVAALIVPAAQAKNDLLGKPAPMFELKNQNGETFKLADRKGKGYTVLFFYPKAGTPGCTKQACAFRDAISTIRKQGAEVYGISADDTASQKKFHDDHKMTFDLLADDKAKVIEQYDVKMFGLGMAKRQTFILDSELVVREHFPDVDPALDAKKVGEAIESLKAQKK